jgi:hypothetical protein
VWQELAGEANRAKGQASEKSEKRIFPGCSKIPKEAMATGLDGFKVC